MESTLARGHVAWLALVCLLAVHAPLRAQSVGGAAGGQPRLSPDPFVVQLRSIPDPVPIPTLIQASLVLSGADAAAIQSDSARIDAIIADARKQLAGIGDPYKLGDALLKYLHSNLFVSYSEPQARIDVLLETGQFNCVSSAVMYMILGRSLGLDVEAVYTPDHAFCTVDIGGKKIDVETTNQYGFDPGTKRGFSDAFGRTGFTYVPPGDYRLRTATEEKGLLSFILQDRISLLERRSDFQSAVGLAVDRNALLGSASSFDDGANEIANWCAWLNQQGRYEQGLSFLEQARASYGDAPVFAKVGAALVNNEVIALLGSGSFDQAERVIRTEAANGLLPQATASSLLRSVAERKLANAVGQEPFQSALSAANASYQNGDIGRAFYVEVLVSLYAKAAQADADRQDYLAAARLISEGLQATGGDARLKRGYDIYVHNYAALVHNRFVALYNDGQIDAAISLLEQGLAQLPGNSILTNDLQLAQKQKSGG